MKQAALPLGIILFWTADAFAQGQPTPHPSGPASQPASRPAHRGEPGGKASDVRATVTIAYRFGDKELTAEEFWHLSNPSPKSVAASELTVSLPADVRLAVVDESTPTFKASEDSRAFLATAGIDAHGRTEFGARYLQRFSGGKLEVKRTLPFAVDTLRVIVEHAPGVRLASIEPVRQRRETEMGGVRFVIFDLGPQVMGSELAFTLQGLPSHRRWPKYVAAALSVALMAWMILSLLGKRPAEATRQAGVLSAPARRDQILKAIEVLNRDFLDKKVKDKRYERRYAELVTALAATLREAEISKTRAKGRAQS